MPLFLREGNIKHDLMFFFILSICTEKYDLHIFSNYKDLRKVFLQKKYELFYL